METSKTGFVVPWPILYILLMNIALFSLLNFFVWLLEIKQCGEKDIIRKM